MGDVLLTLMAPPLVKVLEVSFLSGVVVFWKLQAQHKVLGNSSVPGMPRLPRRRRLRLTPRALAYQADSGSSTPGGPSGRPKAPPNDPERQGNIWHRYEQLEHATKSLASLNAQLVSDKNRHQRERRRLEEALLDLSRANEKLAAQSNGSANGRGARSVALAAVTADSAALLADLATRTRAAGGGASPCGSPFARTETQRDSSVSVTAERLRLEVEGARQQLSQAQKAAALAASSAAARLAKREEAMRGLEAENACLRATSQGAAPTGLAASAAAARTAAAAAELAALEAQNEQLQAQVVALDGQVAEAEQRGQSAAEELAVAREAATAAAAGADAAALRSEAAVAEAEQRLASAEQRAAELAEQVAAGRDEAARLRGDLEEARSRAAAAAAAAPDAALTRELEAANRALASEVSALRAAAAIAAHGPDNPRVAELESENSELVAKVASLEANAARLSEGAPAVAEAGELLEALKEENAALQADNEALVAYLDAADDGQGGQSHDQMLETFTLLRAENRELADDIERLTADLAAAQRSTGSSGAAAESGWHQAEALRVENAALLKENSELHARAPMRLPPGPEEQLAADNERLRRQLAALTEAKAAAINEDNARLVAALEQDNAELEAESRRLVARLAGPGGTSADAARDGLLAANDRLTAAKQRALQAASEMAAKNTRLVQENKALGTRVAAAAGNGAKKGARVRGGLFGKFGGKGKDAGDVQRSSDSEGDGNAGLMAAAAGEMARLEAANAQLLAENCELTVRAATAAELSNNNLRLIEENSRLNSSMAALVQELSEENRGLVEENHRLNSSVQKVLEENAELGARLIDLALCADAANDVGGWDAEESRRRQTELQRELASVEQQQAAHMQRRSELTSRATQELAAYERARSVTEEAGEAPRALAMQRLRSMNAAAREAAAQAPAAPAAAPAPATEPDEHAPGPAAVDGTSADAAARQREAEAAKAELAHKIASTRRRSAPDEMPAPPRTLSDLQPLPEENEDPEMPADEAPPPAAQPHAAQASGGPIEGALYARAATKVARAYAACAPKRDVAGFMCELGYAAPPSRGKGDGPPALLRRALRATHPDKHRGAAPEARALAAATHAQLQEWEGAMA
ncbi:hypothetical protein WJX81_002881 [Elliptochloris bilobata]|uniref:Uncharacterized protein n=1 Tax=Elliptochloris bilobata TaxID=381761 RepID=A0AAW1QNM1_9CHLO